MAFVPIMVCCAHELRAKCRHGWGNWRGASAKSRYADCGCKYDAGFCSQLAVATTIQHAAAGGLCRSCTVARGDWHVKRDCIHSSAARTGDWDTYGARRTNIRCGDNGCFGGNEANRCGRRNRSRGRTRNRALHVQLDLWREGKRFRHICRRIADADCGELYGQYHPGISRNAGGTCIDASRRVGMKGRAGMKKGRTKEGTAARPREGVCLRNQNSKVVEKHDVTSP